MSSAVQEVRTGPGRCLRDRGDGQSWHDLLFAHWPVDAAVMRPLLPSQLHIDIF